MTNSTQKAAPDGQTRKEVKKLLRTLSQSDVGRKLGISRQAVFYHKTKIDAESKKKRK